MPQRPEREVRVTGVEIAKGLYLTLVSYLVKIKTDSKDSEDGQWQGCAFAGQSTALYRVLDDKWGTTVASR